MTGTYVHRATGSPSSGMGDGFNKIPLALAASLPKNSNFQSSMQ